MLFKLARSGHVGEKEKALITPTNQNNISNSIVILSHNEFMRQSMICSKEVLFIPIDKKIPGSSSLEDSRVYPPDLQGTPSLSLRKGLLDKIHTSSVKPQSQVV